MERKAALQRAVDLAGGQTDLARKLTDLAIIGPKGEPMKFRQGHVYGWLERGWPPAEVCLGIEIVTENKVTRYELRPEVFGLQRKSEPAA